jgi:hypothetical protein
MNNKSGCGALQGSMRADHAHPLYTHIHKADSSWLPAVHSEHLPGWQHAPHC